MDFPLVAFHLFSVSALVVIVIVVVIVVVAETNWDSSYMNTDFWQSQQPSPNETFQTALDDCSIEVVIHSWEVDTDDDDDDDEFVNDEDAEDRRVVEDRERGDSTTIPHWNCPRHRYYQRSWR